MKRTLLVLALMVCAAVGCRAVNPNCGDACGDPCMGPASRGPQPVGLRADGYCDGATSGNFADSAGTYGAACDAACDECGVFNRYCGHDCGPGYPAGPYDCSPCGSPNWGCNGYQHLAGDPNTCYAGGGAMGHGHGVHQAGYCCCCGQPGPGCHCGMCCPSGDQNYNFNPGPPVGQTAYPYYTTRGPRDFLMANPPSIGPY